MNFLEELIRKYALGLMISGVYWSRSALDGKEPNVASSDGI